MNNDALKVAADMLLEAGVPPRFIVVDIPHGICFEDNIHETREAAETEIERLIQLGATRENMRIARVWMFEG
jgi:hypothetical protein